jgi:probable rRNA maturation factor
MNIDIQYATIALEKAVKVSCSKSQLLRWIRASSPPHSILTIRFVNRAEIQKLNRDYRGKMYSPNVLTFNYANRSSQVEADIILCWPVLQAEAKQQHKSLSAHLAHLLIHGCLHAQGFDHENRRDAKEMEDLEIQLLSKFGFTNPYLTL